MRTWLLTFLAMCAVALAGVAGSPAATAENPDAQAATSRASSSLAVVVPCSGGPGRIALRSRETADGATLANARLSHLTGKRWSGATYTEYPPVWERFTARHHGFRDRGLHPQSWGDPATGYYVSHKLPETLCIADLADSHDRITAGADYLGVQTHPGRRSLMLFFSVARVTTWDVRIRISRSDRRDLILERQVTTDQDANAVTTFRRLRHLATVTGIAVHVSRVGNPKDVLWMRFHRTP